MHGWTCLPYPRAGIQLEAVRCGVGYCQQLQQRSTSSVAEAVPS
jgi:hypothetical protein